MALVGSAVVFVTACVRSFASIGRGAAPVSTVARLKFAAWMHGAYFAV
jgi:hypothetical protein